MVKNERIHIYLILVLIVLGCKGTALEEVIPIQNVVGEIFQDDNQDDIDFKLCNAQNEIIQYYAFNEKTYEGEKIAIEDEFAAQYKADADHKDSGWVRIRFIVNCKGAAGRYRISGMDLKYKKKHSPLLFLINCCALQKV